MVSQTNKIKNEVVKSKSNIENNIKSISEKMRHTTNAIQEANQMRLSNFCFSF
jgi:hypothetical protein